MIANLEDVFCPATPAEEAPRPRFEIQKDFAHPILERFRGFLEDNGMKIAAIEIIENASGDVFAYDVNVNTNYNADAERRAGASGMGAVARYLGAELARQTEEPSKQPVHCLDGFPLRPVKIVKISQNKIPHFPFLRHRRRRSRPHEPVWIQPSHDAQPRTDRGRGRVFEYAYSNSTWTRPSTVSFLTSLQHSVLGGLRNGRNMAPEEVATIAQHLRRAGY